MNNRSLEDDIKSMLSLYVALHPSARAQMSVDYTLTDGGKFEAHVIGGSVAAHFIGGGETVHEAVDAVRQQVVDAARKRIAESKAIASALESVVWP